MFGNSMLPSGIGLGLIIYFFAIISQCVAVQCFLSRYEFKRNTIIEKIGSHSYESYLSGGIAMTVALCFSTNRCTYYILYGGVFLLVGAMIHLLINKSRQTIRKQIK